MNIKESNRNKVAADSGKGSTRSLLKEDLQGIPSSQPGAGRQGIQMPRRDRQTPTNPSTWENTTREGINCGRAKKRSTYTKQIPQNKITTAHPSIQALQRSRITCITRGGITYEEANLRRVRRTSLPSQGR